MDEQENFMRVCVLLLVKRGIPVHPELPTPTMKSLIEEGAVTEGKEGFYQLTSHGVALLVEYKLMMEGK